MTTLLRGLYAAQGPQREGQRTSFTRTLVSWYVSHQWPRHGPRPRSKPYVVMWVMFLSLGDRKLAGYIRELKASLGQMRLCFKNKQKGKTPMAPRKLWLDTCFWRLEVMDTGEIERNKHELILSSVSTTHVNVEEKNHTQAVLWPPACHSIHMPTHTLYTHNINKSSFKIGYRAHLQWRLLRVY